MEQAQKQLNEITSGAPEEAMAMAMRAAEAQAKAVEGDDADLKALQAEMAAVSACGCHPPHARQCLTVVCLHRNTPVPWMTNCRRCGTNVRSRVWACVCVCLSLHVSAGPFVSICLSVFLSPSVSLPLSCLSLCPSVSLCPGVSSPAHVSVVCACVFWCVYVCACKFVSDSVRESVNFPRSARVPLCVELPQSLRLCMCSSAG